MVELYVHLRPLSFYLYLIELLTCTYLICISICQWLHLRFSNFCDHREQAKVKFPMIFGKLTLLGDYYEIKNELQIKRWNLQILLEDIRREQSMLDQARLNFEVKRQEFVQFLAQSSHRAWVMLAETCIIYKLCRVIVLTFNCITLVCYSDFCLFYIQD